MAAGIGGHGRSELARVLAASRRFVTPASAAKSLDIGAPAAARRLARWAEDGWLRRVWRGLYIAVPVDAVNPAAWSEDALVVAAEVWAPCYFTGWTAANHWALTEQVFRTTVLKTSSRVRSATARLLDNDYLVSHVAPDVLAWGMRTEWRAETRLRFADPARTVVDMLDEPRIGAGIRHTAEVLVSYLDAHDPMRLVEWGDRLGNHAIFERLGYLIETVGLDRPALVDACLDRVSSGVALLDPDGPGDGSRIMRWRLRVNAMVGFEGAA